jgi:hypothetical protein
MPGSANDYFYQVREALSGGKTDADVFAALCIDPAKERGPINDRAMRSAVAMARDAQAILDLVEKLPNDEIYYYERPGKKNKADFLAALTNQERAIKCATPQTQCALGARYLAEVFLTACEWRPDVINRTDTHQPEPKKDELRRRIANLKPMLTMFAIAAFQDASHLFSIIGDNEASSRMKGFAEVLCGANQVQPEDVDYRIRVGLGIDRFEEAFALLKKMLTGRNGLQSGMEWRIPSTTFTTRLKAIRKVMGMSRMQNQADMFQILEPPKNEVTMAVDFCNVGVQWEPDIRRLTFTRPSAKTLFGGNGSRQAQWKEEAREGLMQQLHAGIERHYPEAANGNCAVLPHAIMIKNPPEALLSDLHIEPEERYHSKGSPPVVSSFGR